MSFLSETISRYNALCHKRLRRYSKQITIHNYQLSEFRQKHPQDLLFWGFLYYKLSKSVPEIDPKNLEEITISRDLYFLNWEYLHHLEKVTPITGPYRYARKLILPPETEFYKFKQDKNTLYVPRNANTLADIIYTRLQYLKNN